MVTQKGRATRDRIVAAAANLMYIRGVAGTSTEDVQLAAGVSASQIYHYFADKRSLTRAVIGYQTDAILGIQEPALARLDDLDALRAWADSIVAFQRNNDFRGGCPLGTLANELAESDTDAREDLATYRPALQGVTPSTAAEERRAERADLERVCVSRYGERCTFDPTVHCPKCGRWFCDAHGEDEKWHNCALPI